MIKTRTLSIALTSILTILLVIPTYANQLRLEEGVTLHYKWARVSSGTGGLETGNAMFEILALNQTTLIARVVAKQSLDLKIEYENGTPIYADYLEGLIYLPPNCIVQSLQGNLNWTSNIKTKTMATVINGTIQTQDFSTDAGVFQCINLTLNLAGWEFGNLTLIYDVSSGILIYEQWIPEYGDIIVHALTTVHNSTIIMPNTPCTIDVRQEANCELVINNVSKPTTINIKNVTAPDVALPETYKLLGTCIQISTSENVTVNATIRIYYTSEQLSALELDENSLKIFYFDAASNQWIEKETKVNTSEHYAEATIDHLSLWALFGKPLTPLWQEWWFLAAISAIVIIIVVAMLFLLKRKSKTSEI